MNKYGLVFLLLIITAAANAQTYALPKLSSYDIATWANQGGFIASGAVSPVTSPPRGSLYVDESIPNLPVLWRYNGTVWYKISGGASKHYELLNLDYATAGHTGFAPITAIPNNASFTLSLLSEKDFASLTGKPTNASYTLAGLSEKNFASLTAKPTTLAGYGITDAAASSTFFAHVAQNVASLSAHIADNIDPHGATMTVTQEMIVGVGSLSVYFECPSERVLRVIASETIIPEALTVAGTVKFSTIPVYVDNAGAIANGAAVGSIFRTSTGALMLVH